MAARTTKLRPGVSGQKGRTAGTAPHGGELSEDRDIFSGFRLRFCICY